MYIPRCLWLPYLTHSVNQLVFGLLEVILGLVTVTVRGGIWSIVVDIVTLVADLLIAVLALVDGVLIGLIAILVGLIGDIVSFIVGLDIDVVINILVL